MRRILRITAICALGAMLAIAAAGCSGGKAQAGITAKAEGWSASSTPVIAHIASDDGKTDVYHALSANEEGKVALADGEYELSFITPINADGSIYAVPAPIALTVKGGKAEPVSVELSPIPAGDVTADQMEAALRAIAAAVAKGDGTLSGDAGKSIMEKAARNAAASGKVDEDAAKAVEDEAEAVAQAQQAQSSGAAAPASSGGSPSGGESGGSAAGPATPQHEHSWATRTVDDGDVWVVDQAAWDEQVVTGGHIHCTCGMDWYDSQSYANHQDEALCRYSVVTDYEWVHHDEVGHYEHMSHTETYCTGCGAVQ